MADLTIDVTQNTILSGTGGIKIDPAANQVVTINKGVLLPDGSKDQPAIRFDDDTNTGIYSPNNDNIGLVTHGQESLRVSGVPNASNYVTVTSSLVGSGPVIGTAGGDTNIDLELRAQGAGHIVHNANQVHFQLASSDNAFINSKQILVDGNNVSQLTNDAGFITIDHTHTKSDITDFSDGDYATSAQGAKADSALQDLTAESITTLSDVSTFMTPLEGQTLVFNDVNGWQAETISTNWGDIGGVLSDQTDLQNALNGKAESDHTHTKSDITDFSDGDYATSAQGAKADSALQDLTTESIQSLSDVGAMTPSSGQVLTYSDVDGWVAETPAAASGTPGYLYSGTITTQPAGSGEDSITIGDGANSGINQGVVAIGKTANAIGESCVVIGNNARTEAYGTQHRSVCIGLSAYSNGADNVCIGNGASNYTKDSNVAIGKSAVTSNGNAIALGNTSDATGYSSMSLGFNTDALGFASIAMGSGSYASAAGGNMAIGDNADADGQRSLALGRSTKSDGDHSTVIGHLANSTTAAKASVAIGFSSKAAHDGAISISSGLTSAVTSTQDNEIQIGQSDDQTLGMKDHGNMVLTGSAAQYVMPSYTVATLPTGTLGGMILVTDDVGGAVPAFFDGTNWLRTTDRAIIS